jgi:6-phosphogluconolactonase
MKIFKTSEELADALADDVAAALRERLARDGKAALAVSGGTTPVKFFHALSAKNLNWSKVTITLADDRWVPEESQRSNAGLVKKHLLRGFAAAAKFVPLVTGHDTPEDGCPATQAVLKLLPLPFAAVVLGLGTDGHTASLFPHGDRLEQALAPGAGRLVETMRCDAADEPRITLTLPVLLAANHIFIHIEGETKRHVLDAARHDGPLEDMPVRAVLARNPPPGIFWSP